MESSFLKNRSAAAIGNHNHEGLSGAIFMCNKITIQECLQSCLFGLPLSRRNIVEQVVPGTLLFLFEYENRELHGIFEASSFGDINIEPEAFKSSGSMYPCQVRCKMLIHCAPLYEFEFKKAIKDNYFSEWKFKFNLRKQQVSMLVDMFLKRIEDSEMSFMRGLVGGNRFDQPGIEHCIDICRKESNENIRETALPVENGDPRELFTRSKTKLSVPNDNELINTHCKGTLIGDAYIPDYYVRTDDILARLYVSPATVAGPTDVYATSLCKNEQIHKSDNYNLHLYSDRDAYISHENNLPMEVCKFTDQSLQHAAAMLSISGAPVYDNTMLSSSMVHGELLDPNSISLYRDVTYPGPFICQSDTLVDVEAYPDCEHLSSVRTKKHWKSLSSEVLLANTHSFRKRRNERESVWSRISGYKGSMDGHSAKKEKIDEFAEDEATDLQFVAETSAGDPVLEDSNHEMERNLFNYARKKRLASPSNVNEKEHNNSNKGRRKLVRPDFSGSAELHDPSKCKPEAVQESTGSKHVVADANIHSNYSNGLQVETGKEKLQFDFDLNQLNMEADDREHVFPTITNISSSEIDSPKLEISQRSTVLLNPPYFEAGLDKSPLSLTKIALNTKSLSFSAGFSLHDILKKEHMHAVQLNWHGSNVEEDLTSISVEASDVFEKHETPKQSLLATEPKDVISGKFECMGDLSSLKPFNDDICAKEDYLREVEIPSIATNLQRHMREPICLNFLKIETPHAIGPGTSQVLPRYPQEYFLKAGQRESNMSFRSKEEEILEAEKGRAADDCNQCERETEATVLESLDYVANFPEDSSEPLGTSKLNLRNAAGQGSLGGDNNQLNNLDASIPFKGKCGTKERDFLQDQPFDATLGEETFMEDNIRLLDSAAGNIKQELEKAIRRDTVYFHFI